MAQANYQESRSVRNGTPPGSDALVQVPAHDVTAERSVLGAMLLDGDVVSDVAEMLDSGDFYLKRHRLLFQAMLHLWEKDTPIEVVTLVDELRRRELLEETGVPEYLEELAAEVSATTSAVFYARIVRDKAICRTIVSVGQNLATEGGRPPFDSAALIETAEQSIADLAERQVVVGFRSMAELAPGALAFVERLSRTGTRITGVATGYAELDLFTSGLQPEEYVLLAARPSMGKTALALNIARRARMPDGRPARVAIYSMEMSKEALTLRLLCSMARVNTRLAEMARLRGEDLERVAVAAEELATLPLMIDDSPALTPLEMRTRSRRAARHQGVDLIIADYLQLMECSKPADTREREIGMISRSFKRLAKHLGIPVLALCQLNREPEKRPDKRPKLGDLRESGTLEQDADVVWFLYRDEMYNRETEAKGIAEVIVAKQRNGGPSGVTAQLRFFDECQSFENLETRPGMEEQAPLARW